MKSNAAIEDRLEALGVTLRTRPRVADRVMDEVRRLPEPLSPHAERLRRQAAGEATTRPAHGNAWKLVTAGAVAAVCLVVLFLLAMSQYINNSPTPASQPTVAQNETRHLSLITVEEIDPSEGSAYLADEVRRLDVELKSLQQTIEKKSVQRQIVAVLRPFGEAPSPTPE